MKRLVLHLMVAIGTFTGGMVVDKILAARPQVVLSPQIQEVHPVAPMLFDVSLPLSIPTPTPNLILDYEPERFAPRGDYFIIGSKPKEFREFDCLELAMDEIHGQPRGNVLVQTYSNGQYESQAIVFALITDHQLYVKTTSRSEEEGFDYTFDGEFLRGGVVSDAAPGKAVLRGKLTKLKQGRKVAECQVKFRVEYLGC